MPPYEHVAWDVPYAPGVLEARGYDASGKQIAREKLETTGQANALRLTPDRKNLTADNQDATVVEVSVVDAQGRIVPDADPQITFAFRARAKTWASATVTHPAMKPIKQARAAPFTDAPSLSSAQRKRREPLKSPQARRASKPATVKLSAK